MKRRTIVLMARAYSKNDVYAANNFLRRNILLAVCCIKPGNIPIPGPYTGGFKSSPPPKKKKLYSLLFISTVIICS